MFPVAIFIPYSVLHVISGNEKENMWGAVARRPSGARTLGRLRAGLRTETTCTASPLPPPRRGSLGPDQNRGRANFGRAPDLFPSGRIFTPEAYSRVDRSRSGQDSEWTWGRAGSVRFSLVRRVRLALGTGKSAGRDSAAWHTHIPPRAFVDAGVVTRGASFRSVAPVLRRTRGCGSCSRGTRHSRRAGPYDSRLQTRSSLESLEST